MERHYRARMNRGRFHFFPSVYKASDILLGIARGSFDPGMATAVLEVQESLHRAILEHETAFPGFLDSLEPLACPASMKKHRGRKPGASGMEGDTTLEGDTGPDGGAGRDGGAGLDWRAALARLYACGEAAGTGPMAAVAGLFAREAGRCLEEGWGVEELIAENGGDLYIRNREDLLSVIHAGKSALSDRLGLVLPPGSWGMCTSSGTLGPSFSKGKADALCVVAECPALADAWATSLANRVGDAGDIQGVLEEAAAIDEILAIVVMAGDQVGVRGQFELKAIS